MENSTYLIWIIMNENNSNHNLNNNSCLCYLAGALGTKPKVPDLVPITTSEMGNLVIPLVS